ncbi:MraY family glycosyltransferase [Geomonas oryzae]|uniref:MraY family glycosyltransferase n=1 Tax=Geomonas oryzae TaxID=2364273 RepID=UPI00100A4A91|nr:MraY family glycosyltransferase [Geomonas oryzae]
MNLLTTLIASMLLTAVAIPILSRVALWCNLVDLPNERKVHNRPIPRVGGLAMVLGTCAPLIRWEWGNEFLHAYLAGALVLVLFGLADDLWDISPLWKLCGQSIAATVIIVEGGVRIATLGSLLPAWLTVPAWMLTALTLITIVGVTNAINLADGLDGLAGGISLLCIAEIGFMAWQEGDAIICLIAVALCGAIFGFLRYNTFPASVFMGDTGSQFLGFSAITLALSLTQGVTPLSPVVPLLILGFPVLDTMTVMTGRIARGCSPFAADKTHFHHNLLALGLHHTESVLVIYLIQVSLVVAAYYLRFFSDWLLLGGYLLFSTAVLALFALSRKRNWEPRRTRALTRVKERLRVMRDETPVVIYMFRALCFLYPALLVLTFALSGPPSTPFALSAVVFMLALAAMRFLLPAGFEPLLHAIIYLIVPYGVYLSGQWLDSQAPLAARACNVVFGLVTFLFILVPKVTRRNAAFKSTPMDFLIVFLAAAALLPEAATPDFRLGMVAVKILILYYGCEVLMAELRGEYAVLAGGTVAALAIPVVRWAV